MHAQSHERFAPANHPRARRTAQASQMRLKHGVYSSRAVITGESELEFQEFRHDMILSLLPGDRVEDACVDQMVMAQWKLKRLWAAQTGVYIRHEKAHPADPSTSDYPEWVAACVDDDNAGEGSLHRLSIEEVRLTGMFHRAHRRLEELRGLRLKRLVQRRRDPYPEIEDYDATSGPFLRRELAGMPSDSSPSPSRDSTDRRAPAPQPPATGAVPPSPSPAPFAEEGEGPGVRKGVPFAGEGEGPEVRKGVGVPFAEEGDGPAETRGIAPAPIATPSSESSSRKNADRDGSASTNGKREFPLGTDATTPPEIVARLRELNAEYWKLRREVNKQDWAEAS